MAIKNEKTLSILADDELGTVSGGSVLINGDLSFLSNVAKAKKGGTATAGTANEVDSSQTAFSLIAGLLGGIA